MHWSDQLAKIRNDRSTSEKTHPECQLTKTLVEMDFSSVSDMFAQNETGSPTVLWNPSKFDITLPIIRNFSLFMQGRDARGKCLSAADFANLKTEIFEPWVMILEPVGDGSDFKYLKYGSEIAAMFGRDMTEHCTSEIGGHVSEFFIALYTAVTIRKQSVLSVHEPPLGVFATVWRRLILPLMDEAGQVRMIAAVNVPDNELRAGLEALPDPALVTQSDGLLMYANSSARRLFGDLAVPRVHISEYCNIDINLPDNAESFASAESSTSSQEIGTNNQILVHFETRTSATYFRGTPYFVVQLKPY